MSLFDEFSKAYEDKARFSTPLAVSMFNNPHFVETAVQKLLSDVFMETVLGANSRTIISIGSQLGKSLTTTVAGVAWLLKHYPDKRVIVVSYSEDLAKKFGGQIKSYLIEMGVPISKESSSKADFSLEGHRGGVKSVGINGTITGVPADLIVIDDPIKGPEDANSLAAREALWEWYGSVANTRLGSGASLILTMTRWHHDDLAGRLMRAHGTKENGGLWSLYSVPARAGENDILGREPGEWLENARGWTEEDWKRKELEMGSKSFACIYQCSPTPAGGAIFDVERIEYTSMSRLNMIEDGQWISSWDMASSTRKGSDYTVGQVWVKRNGKLYLMDMVRGQWSFTQTIRQFEAVCDRWPKLSRHVVETKSNGPAFIDSLKQAGVQGVIPFSPEKYGSKILRADRAAASIESGNVVFMEDYWNTDILSELSEFPDSRNDDTVDSLSQAIIYLTDIKKKRSPFITYGVG